MEEFDIQKLPPLTAHNSFECNFYPDKKTLPVFDKFQEEKYQYLIIRYMGSFKKRIKFHLIISKIPFGVETRNLKTSRIGGALTATFLKSTFLSINSRREVADYITLNPLAEEVYLALYGKSFQKEDVVYLQTPCAFYAQDSSHRSGFGLRKDYTSAYDDNVLYGEARKYAIVGIKVFQI